MRIKIAFYLDSLTGGAPCDPRKPLPPFANRCADQLQQDIRQSQECWSIPGQDVPVTILETNPGDLVLFNHNTTHASSGEVQMREVRGAGELSAPSLIAQFGLNDETRLDSIVVRWPSGDTRTIGPLAAGRVHVVAP